MFRTLLVALATFLSLAFSAGAATIDITGCTALAPCGPTTVLNGTIDPNLTITGSVGPSSTQAAFQGTIDWGNEGIGPTATLSGVGAISYTFSQTGVGILNSGSISLNGGSFGLSFLDIYSSFFSGGAQALDTFSLIIDWVAGPANGGVNFVVDIPIVNSFCFTGGGVCDQALNNQVPAPVPVPPAIAALAVALMSLFGLGWQKRRKSKSALVSATDPTISHRAASNIAALGAA